MFLWAPCIFRCSSLTFSWIGRSPCSSWAPSTHPTLWLDVLFRSSCRQVCHCISRAFLLASSSFQFWVTVWFLLVILDEGHHLFHCFDGAFDEGLHLLCVFFSENSNQFFCCFGLFLNHVCLEVLYGELALLVFFCVLCQDESFDVLLCLLTCWLIFPISNGSCIELPWSFQVV